MLEENLFSNELIHGIVTKLVVQLFHFTAIHFTAITAAQIPA